MGYNGKAPLEVNYALTSCWIYF